MGALRINKIEAEFACWQLAYAWVSEAAHSIDSDFYIMFGCSQVLNDKLLGDEDDPFFRPTDEEKILIINQMRLVSNFLLSKMRSLRKEYEKLQPTKPQ